ncbi:hypothetical protein BKX95_09915 [Streptococcus iniae]|nr:hypothetical protein BKX95_09915 [Streptococcus iniae]
MSDFLNTDLTPEDFVTINQFLGRKIKKARLENELSITDLSRVSGMAGSYISLVENGKKPKLSMFTLLRLCFFLNVNPSEFFNGIEELPPFSNDQPGN